MDTQKNKVGVSKTKVFDHRTYRLSVISKHKSDLQLLGKYGAAKKHRFEFYRVAKVAGGYGLYVR